MITEDTLKEILARDDNNTSITNSTSPSSLSSSPNPTMKLSKKAKVSASPLFNLPNEILTECLLYLPLPDTCSFAQTNISFYNCWNDSLHFNKLLERDYPNQKEDSPDKKELYKLHTSISSGYDPRWYKLNNVTSSQNPTGRRQGFGKAMLLGCPVVYGGWVVSRHGFVLVDCDVLYLRKQTLATQKSGGAKSSGVGGSSRTMFFSEQMTEGETTISSTTSERNSSNGKDHDSPPAGYDWATIQTSGTSPRESYCVAATAYDYVPISSLKNVNGFEEIAFKRNWILEDEEIKTMPALFVSGGVTEGGYRFALSQLYALVGGTVKKEAKPKASDKDTQKKEGEEEEGDGDAIQKYDWHWIKLSGGTNDEISQNATTVPEAIQSVVDSIDPSSAYNHRNDPPHAASQTKARTCSDVVSAYGGSARACHSLWYDSRLHSLCVFGGFTDMVARKSHVVNGAFNMNACEQTRQVGKEQEENVMGHRLIHQSLHQLEVFDISKGRWGRVLQSGAYPLGRFGCSVIDVTSKIKKGEEEGTSRYLVIGGCTGRHNHKGPMEDGEELVGVTSHRVLTLHRVHNKIEDIGVELIAKWRVLNAAEQANLGMEECHEGTTLGRLHASCAISEHSHIFFGGGPSYRCSSSLVLMKKCYSSSTDSAAKVTSEGRGEGSTISCTWKNKGKPLTPYHYWDGEDRNTAETTLLSPTSDDMTTSSTATPYVPPVELARMDCLLEADPNRPGEAFMFGGWREEELGDTWKLVVGIEREDEATMYGERISETSWNEREEVSSNLGSVRVQPRGRMTPGLFHRFWG